MTELETVLKNLHDLRKYLEDKEWSDETATAYIPAVIEAEKLLKEQEAVEPIDIGYEINVPYQYRCGKCKSHIRKEQKYCDICGQAVKWE